MSALRTTLALSMLCVACRSAAREAPLPVAAPSAATVAPSAAQVAVSPVFGDWVLYEVRDRANLGHFDSVQLSLRASAFALTASAPAGAPLLVTGSATSDGNGAALILTPRSITRGGESLEHAGWLVVGLPVRLVASVAGGAMIVQSQSAPAVVAKSVWHRREAAIAARDPGAPVVQSAGDATSMTAPH